MRCAITGAIGSGKSVCLNILANLGYVAISADAVNAELLKSAEYLHKLAIFFPECFENGKLDKKALRSLISENEEKRITLNAIAHSEIKRLIFDILTPYANSKEKIFIEAPLLVESGMASFFDEIWNVVASRELCIKRAEQRDGIPEKEIEMLYMKQATDEERRKIATINVLNIGSMDDLREKVVAALKNQR